MSVRKQVVYSNGTIETLMKALHSEECGGKLGPQGLTPAGSCRCLGLRGKRRKQGPLLLPVLACHRQSEEGAQRPRLQGRGW